MSVTSLYKLLDAATVKVREAVAEAYLKPIWHAYNAMYEQVTDTAAPPTTGTQIYHGHDHGIKGGPPIARQSGICEDGGSNPLWDNSPVTANQRTRVALDGGSVATSRGTTIPTFYTYSSPNLERVRRTSPRAVLRLSYKATNSNFRLYISELSTDGAGRKIQIDLPETSSEEGQRWIRAVGIPISPGNWSRIEIEIENDAYDVDNLPNLKIFAFYLWETKSETSADEIGSAKL